MIDQQTAERIRSAYRAAADAVEVMRAALVAAGILQASPAESPAESPTEIPGESSEARRRRLKADRQRRWRERRAVDAGASTRPPAGASPDRLRVDAGASTQASTGASTVDAGASTPGDAGPHARARTSSGEVISPDVFSLTLKNIPAPTTGSMAAIPTSAASARSARRKAPARERPALRPGSTIDPTLGSAPVPVPDRAPEAAGVDSVPADVRRLWSVYTEAVAPTRPRLTPTRVDLLRRRLRDYTADELERSIRGYGRSAFHRGENDRGRPYQSLELWLRDAAHVEAGWSYLDAKTAPRRSEKKGAPALDGLSRDWQEYEARLEADRDVFADT